jgi:DNA-binding beta-propeller fold protein YncE
MKYFVVLSFLLTFAASAALAQSGNGEPVQTLQFGANQLLSDPVRDYIYATVPLTNSLAVIDSVTLQVVNTISVGADPNSMSISKDNSKLYIGLRGAMKIAVIDLTTLTALPSLNIASVPYSIAIGLDDRLYVSSLMNVNNIIQVNALTGATEQVVLSGNGDGVLQISPDRKTLYFGDVGIEPATLSSFDVSTATATMLQQSAFGTVGESGRSLVLSHNGQYLCFFTDGGDVLVDPANLSIVYGFLPSGRGVTAFSPDDATIYVVEEGSSQIALIDSATLKQFAGLDNVFAALIQGGIATSRTGRYLFFASDDDVGTIDETAIYDLLAQPMPASYVAHTGQSISYQAPIYISGTASATGLPSGVTFDAATRMITGTPTKAGTFPIVVTATNGTTTVTFDLTLAVYPNSRAANISTRAQVETGEDILIAGFIVYGPEGKNIVLRGLGPSLGVTGELVNPTISLHDSTGAVIATNDDWSTDAQAFVLTNLDLAPSEPQESGLFRSLAPGAYTVTMSGVGNTTGVGLVELYDVDEKINGLPADYSRLGNISTRSLVGNGDNVMIAGTILVGPDDATLLIRGIGPSLAKAGITSPLANPYLELHNSDGTTIASNDNWQDTQKTLIEATGLAPTDPAESAIDTTLQPGAYTAILSGVADTTGVGLVEIYNLP